MKNKQDDSKPEGFKREFRYNAWFIICIGGFVMIVVGALIKHFW